MTANESIVFDIVNRLAVKYREVIHLFYYEGYSTAEIAGLLHKNESTVRSLLHRAREKLKVDLKGDYDFDEQIHLCI
jgi:RNA polymerase sigma factor (sigma-70 family)